MVLSALKSHFSRRNSFENDFVLRGRAWIEERLQRASFEYFPLPHIIVENFFPADIYRKILQLNPFSVLAGSEWLSRSDAAGLKSDTPYWLRKQFNFPEDISALSNQEHAVFWTAFFEIFQKNNWFVLQLMRKFSDYFSLRYGPLVIEDDFINFFEAKQFLQRHDREYFLGPHTDVPIRVVTCLFSFADNDDFEKFGTELCVPKDRMVRCSGRSHHAPENFKVVKISPYKPNNFFAFLKTPHSFHSVAKINRDIPNERYGMQFQLYEKNEVKFKDLTAIENTSDNPIFQQKSQA